MKKNYFFNLLYSIDKKNNSYAVKVVIPVVSTSHAGLPFYTEFNDKIFESHLNREKRA